MTRERLEPFSTVEIMFEFSKAIQHGLLSLDSLNRLHGVDANKVSALAEAVRRTHAEVTAYIVTLIAIASAVKHEEPSAEGSDNWWGA
jgi:hypothetical protein